MAERTRCHQQATELRTGSEVDPPANTMRELTNHHYRLRRLRRLHCRPHRRRCRLRPHLRHRHRRHLHRCRHRLLLHLRHRHRCLGGLVSISRSQDRTEVVRTLGFWVALTSCKDTDKFLHECVDTENTANGVFCAHTEDFAEVLQGEQAFGRVYTDRNIGRGEKERMNGRLVSNSSLRNGLTYRFRGRA